MAKIVYEDNELIIVDKPQGIATVPGIIEDICTDLFLERPSLALVNGYNDKEGGLLNRLDNETGGLVLFATTNSSFQKFSEIMKSEQVTKEYFAIVDGLPDKNHGLIESQISHHPKSKSKMCIYDKNKCKGKPQKAITEWFLLDQNNNQSLLKIKIKKGVRHQIRVHLASINLPIVGDKLYNKNKSNEKYHLLFCYAVNIPINNTKDKKIEIEIDVIKKYFSNYPNLKF